MILILCGSLDADCGCVTAAGVDMASCISYTKLYSRPYDRNGVKPLNFLIF